MLRLFDENYGMRIIPVIDLLDGLAVHARRGLRSSYQPIASSLSQNPEPRAVLDAYLALYPFTTVYVADLNAIQGAGDNDAVLGELMQRHPAVEFWLDAGPRTLERKAPRLRPVLGSESGTTPGTLQDLATQGVRAVLSLDFNDMGLLGVPELLQQTEVWPEDVIVMSLNRVGSGDGPATELCRRIHGLSAGRNRLYLAGGARDASDLRLASEAGASGMLVATALHSRVLDPAALDTA